jgi:hypothetical protein
VLGAWTTHPGRRTCQTSRLGRARSCELRWGSAGPRSTPRSHPSR